MNIASHSSIRRVLSLLAAGLIPTAIQGQSWRSTLYPENWQRPGESALFYDHKLIQDFSFAGYKRGEEPVPNVTGPVFDVTTYGAVPNTSDDSTLVIQNAIDAAAAAGGGVVYLPAGTFRVSPQGGDDFALRISTSNIVLRGAGTAATFLLNTSHTMNGKAVIQISPTSTSLGATRNIEVDLQGPTRRIPVENVSSFTPGNIVRLQWNFTDEWVNENNQQTWWGTSRPGSSTYLREVVATNPAEGWIEIDVPTRYTMKKRDSANVRTISGLLTNVGVESFAIGNLQHPGTGWGESDYTDPTKAAYDTHASWLIRVQNVRDSWISSVHSRQAAANTSTCHMLSNGISLLSSLRITLQNCQMRRSQYGGGGGNGYMYRVQSSNECLIQNSIADFSRHGFVISHGGTSGNVFFQCEDRETQRSTGSTGSYTTGGSGSDNHMFFSHSNLWDQCHAHNSFYTAHHRTFSGTTPHGVTSAHAVYWNTSGSGTRYTAIVRSEQLHYGYVIGTSGSRSGATNPIGGNTAPADHLEGIGSGATLFPQSLYLDQLSRRLTPTLTYRANGATSGTPQVDTNSPYEPGATVTVLGVGSLTRTGFTFTGWNTAPDGSGTSYAAGNTFQITGSTFLYAQWTGVPYTVTFNANGGSGPDPADKVVEFGTPYGMLAATSRPGFSFVGWFTAAAGGSQVTAATTVTIAEDHMLYARWSAPPVVDAGPDQTVAISEQGLWTPSRISAAAWYDASDTGSISAGDGAITQWDDKSGNDKHLWQNEPTRQPTTGSSSINGLNVMDFSEDYIFTSSGLGADIRSVFMVTANNVSITSSTPAMILLSTAGGGISTGDGYGSSTGAFVGEILSVFDEDTTEFAKRQAASSSKLPTISVGAHLYTYALATNWFIGFDGSDDLRDLSSGTGRNPMLFANSFSIGAGARQHPDTVQFFFDGSVAEVILLDATVSQEERQTIEGYLAHKWGLVVNLPAEHPYKADAPGAPGAIAALNGSASDPENDPLTHTWSVVSGPGPVIFSNASMLNTNATFTVEGIYTLRLTSHDGFNSSFDEVVITVVPQTSFLVTYDGNGETGGTVPIDAGSPYASGETVTILGAGDLVRSGYIFDGWNTTADGTGTDYVPGATFTIDTSITLYARWMPDTYVVSFDANGGSPPDPAVIQVTFSATYGTLPATSRAGFSFDGWFSDASGGSLVTANTSVSIASDHTLYAQWNALPVVDAGPDQTVSLSDLVAWTPAETTIAAWYDAADADTISPSTGAVTTWQDKSGNNNHASQGTAAVRPTSGTATIGGLNTISFRIGDLTNKQFLSTPDHASLNLDSSGGANVFGVLNYLGFTNNGATSNAPLAKGDILAASSSYGIRINENDSLVFKAGSSNNSGSGDFSNQSLIFSGTRNDTTRTGSIHINGTLRNSVTNASAITSDNTSPLHIGRDSATARYADVDWGEILIVGGTLSDQDRQQFEGYLAHKWGQAADLPAEHQYKKNAPGILVANATLNGTVTDVEGDVLTHTWSLVSGPASVAFANASAVDTTATFTEEGVYILRLTSHDGFGSSYDELVITVGDPAPTTPTILAWPTAAVIVEGEALSAATLGGGSASVPGTFNYNDPSIIPGAGSYPAEVTFTPNDTTTYLNVAGTVDVTVLTAFEGWAGGVEITFTGDANGDGVADGLAWLLGAGDPAENANHLLPSAISNNGALEANFRMLNQAKRGAAVLKLQYGTDLETWSTVTIPEVSGTHDGVDFVITPNGNQNEVNATVPASAAGTGGRIFIRLIGGLAAPG